MLFSIRSEPEEAITLQVVLQGDTKKRNSPIATQNLLHNIRFGNCRPDYWHCIRAKEVNHYRGCKFELDTG